MTDNNIVFAFAALAALGVIATTPSWPLAVAGFVALVVWAWRKQDQDDHRP